MKALKKFSALLLSMLLILTAVFIPATITASAATEKDPTQSLIYGIAPSWSAYHSGTGLLYGSSDNSLRASTDGNTINEHNYYSASGTKIVWMLEERASIDSIALWFATNAKYEFAFELYVASSSADLFTEANKVYTHTVTAEGETYNPYLEVTFDEAKTGVLVGMLVIDTAVAGGDGTARIREFSVYGTSAPEKNGTFYENKTLIMCQQISLNERSIITGKAPIIYNRANAASDATSVTSLTQPTSSANNIGYLTDADISAGCYNSPKTDIGGNSAQPWSRIVYELDTLYEVTGFTVYTAHLQRYMDYEIYVGTDKNNVFTGSPVATGCTYSATDGYNFGTQIILADNAVKKATYVGFAFKVSAPEFAASDFTARLKELQVFGTKTSGAVDRWAVAADATTDNLLYGRGLEATSIDKNTADGEWDYANTASTYTYLSNGARLTDGTVSTAHADVQNATNAKLIWTLEKTTDIESFLLFNHSSSKYLTAYEVYASDKLETLFDAENKLYEYTFERDPETNYPLEKYCKAGGQYVEFYGDAVKSANFVAVWLRGGAIASSTDTGIRISEIGFYGTESKNATTNGKLYAATRTNESNYATVASWLGNENYTYENSLLKGANLTLKAGIDGDVINTNTETAELTDGITTGQEMYLHYTSYNDFTYYLGAPTEVEAFMHIKNNQNFTEGYKVYVGYSADTLFTDENLVLDMSDISILPRVYTTAVKFGAPKKGLYLGIRYTGVSTSTALRIAEIAAWGTQEDLGYELTPSIPATSDADTAASSSDYSNLLKGLVAETGYYGSVHSNGTNWINGITDGVANLHYDMNYTAESQADASELFYDLGYTATAYEFAYWMTCAGRQFSYQVYMSDSLDTLYKEPVLVWDYKISPNSVGQKFVLDEPMQVRYVAIRMGDTRVANDSFRTSEIALFGTRDNKAIEGESFATIERVDVEAADEPTYITYTNTFNFPAGQLSGVAKIEEIGTLVYPTTALGDTPLTLDFDGAAKAKSDEKAIAEITEYDKAGYTAVKAQSTFRGLGNVGETTKLTAVSYVIVRYDENTVNTYYSAPMVYSKTQMKRLAAKEQINTYGLLSTDGIITPVDGKTPWNCAIREVWSYAMQAKNLLKTNKTEPIKNAGAWLTDVKTQYGIEQEWLDNGLVTMGDTSRISAVIRKLMKGESVTVVGLGGSITEGYFSGNGSEQSRRVADFLAASFGEDKVTYVNAGIAATGAVMGAYRLNADVLSHNPDLVIVEYAVNDDRGDATAMAAYENLVRTLLSKDVAVLALHNVIYADNEISAAGSANNHKNIGKLYSLPQVSAFDAFYGTEIYAKGNDTTLYYYGTADRPNDGTHPNEKGHAASGALMANLIYTVMCNLEKLPTESAAIPTYPSQPQGNFIDADKAVIVKAQEVNDDGDARVAIEGAAYTESTLAVGKDTTRTNNTYNGYYTVAAGTTATLTLTNVSDAFLVVLENANGDKDAQVVTKDAEGNVVLESTLDTYYNGALSVDAARIINSDERVYHGDIATVTVEITATDAPVYIGGVMGCFN